MTTKQAYYLISTVDSRHQSGQPLLRKLVAGTATENDVTEFLTTDSRYESGRAVLTSLAKHEHVEAEDIDGLNTFFEPLKPLFLSLAAGLEPDANSRAVA
jgi:hypothetical protein